MSFLVAARNLLRTSQLQNPDRQHPAFFPMKRARPPSKKWPLKACMRRRKEVGKQGEQPDSEEAKSVQRRRAAESKEEKSSQATKKRAAATAAAEGGAGARAN